MTRYQYSVPHKTLIQPKYISTYSIGTSFGLSLSSIQGPELYGIVGSETPHILKYVTQTVNALNRSGFTKTSYNASKR